MLSLIKNDPNHLSPSRDVDSFQPPLAKHPQKRTGIKDGNNPTINKIATITFIGILGFKAIARPDAATPLNSVDAILSLSNAQANTGYNTRLQGWITYYNPESKIMFFQDPSGAIRVDPGNGSNYVSGSSIVLSGETRAGDHFPLVVASQSEPVVSLQPIAPEPVTLEGLRSEGRRNYLVTLSGRIQFIREKRDCIQIDVGLGESDFRIFMPKPEDRSELDSTLGQYVAVTGAYVPDFNTKGEYHQAQIYSDSSDSIVIQETPPEIGASEVSCRVLSTQRRTDWLYQLRGTITYATDSEVFLSDGTGSIRVRHQTESLREAAGHEIAVAGFLSAATKSTTLKSITHTVFPQGKTVIPIKVTAKEALKQDMSDQLIEVESVLIFSVAQKKQTILVLQSEEIVYRAAIEGKEWIQHLPPNGSKLRASGICDVIENPADGHAELHLMLRNIDDLVVVSPPLPLVWRRTVQVGTILGFIVLVGGFWALSLQLRVRSLRASMQKQMEFRLGLHRRLQTIGENTSDIIFLLDAKGFVLSANRAARTVHDCIGKNFIEIVSSSDQDAAQAWIKDLCLCLPLPNRQLTLHSENGKERVFDFSTNVTEASDGGIDIQLIGRDLTERLETERHLVESKNSAEEIATFKNTLIANISHELRTPLNGLLGCARLLHEEQLAKEQHELAQHIIESGEALLETLSDLTDYAAIMSGMWAYTESVFSPSAMIQEIIDDKSLSAESASLTLRSQIALDVPQRLYGDASNLRRMLVVLAGNSIKFTPSGRVVISVSLVENLGQGLVKLKFETSDTGIGIDDRAKSWICEPFRQEYSDFNRDFGGMGLGLAICQVLAARLGTKLEFESKKGSGSRFWIQIVAKTA